MVHNHPSGELRPSQRYGDTTDRMTQVGVIVDTEVLDHLVISPTDHLSSKDTGLMDTLRRSTKYMISTMLEHQYKKETQRIREEYDKRVKRVFKEGRRKA